MHAAQCFTRFAIDEALAAHLAPAGEPNANNLRSQALLQMSNAPWGVRSALSFSLCRTRTEMMTHRDKTEVA